MKKIYALLTFLATAFAANAQATLPVYEPFDYTTGQTLDNQAGYTTMSTTIQVDSINIVSGNLQYPDIPAPFGSKINFEGAGSDVRHRKSTRLNSSHVRISYAVFCLK